MESFSKLLSALSGFAWPAVILFAGFYFRVQIRSLFQLARQQIAAGAALKWKDFEFKGLDLASFDTRDGTGYRQELAEKFSSTSGTQAIRQTRTSFSFIE